LLDVFIPSQLGVGVFGGYGAAVHATRCSLTYMPDNFVVVKIDFSNAFNYIHGDSILAAVWATMPMIYRFCCIAYQHISIFNMAIEKSHLRKAFNRATHWPPIFGRRR